MIRTIQVVGIAAVVLAGLIVTLCLGNRRMADCSADQMPSTFDRSQQAEGIGKADAQDRIPPLVQQAQAFALYLNPPPPAASASVVSKQRPVPTTAGAEGRTTPVTEPRPASSSPKFELHGISYYRADPDLSMALIYEQNGGRRWVRPGDALGRVVIDRIDGDCLVYRDGPQTQRMALASGEVLAEFARKTGADSSVGKSSHTVPSVSTPAPPPMRGIRQMPLSRVAAKLGRPGPEAKPPSHSHMETD